MSYHKLLYFINNIIIFVCLSLIICAVDMYYNYECCLIIEVRVNFVLAERGRGCLCASHASLFAKVDLAFLLIDPLPDRNNS